MKINTRFIARALCFAALFLSPCFASAVELNSILMDSTFEIIGPNKTPGKTTFGTAFFMLKPEKNDSQKAYYVLITASHVLEDIPGDNAVLILRKRTPNGFKKFSYPIKIRHNGRKLYVENPNADVAAMYVSLPAEMNFQFLPTQYLADDATLERLEVHPGDELFCLGFPLSADFNGFPILRTGTLASYPVTPSKTVKRYIFTFHIFPGNSGGPVYFSFENRTYGHKTHIGMTNQAVIGLVSQQASSLLPEYKSVPLDVSIVVPSPYIRDTIDMLSEAPK